MADGLGMLLAQAQEQATAAATAAGKASALVQQAIALAGGEPTDPAPTPGPEMAPGTVRIGDATYLLSGINPAGTDYPGGRGPDQLVAYLGPVKFTATNMFGTEATVVAGRVLAVVDRQATRQTAGVIVPVGGYVLSGHGKARDWLNQHAVKGAAVTLEHSSSETPQADPAPSTPTSTGRQLAVYLKMWPSRLPGLAAAAVPGITEVRLAFLQGSPPKLVGYGSQDLAGLVRDAEALRARGVAVSASVGGAGGMVNLRSRETFLQGFGAVHASIGLDRWDVDVEASALPGDDVVAIAQAAHDRWGLGCTLAPNGSNVDTYLPIAVELHRRGLLAGYGQQLYDAPVSLDAARWRIDQAVTAGLPPSVVQVGMMIGNDSRHWSLDTCAANMAAIAAEWPEIGGAYLWSETHGEVAEWAARMSAVLA